MKAFATLRGHRWRLRFAALALLALLFQQAALAGYTCPDLVRLETTPTVMAGCEGMQMPDPDAPALCQQHCLRDDVANLDLKVPQVSPQVLPPLHLAVAEALLLPVQAQYYENVPTCRSDPPPAQRFCSLQI